MAGLKNISIIVLICIIFIFPVNIIFSSETESDKNAIENPEVVASSEDKDKNTRSSLSARSNFQIISSKPVLMPEVNNSWIQNNWSGGPGQDLWSDDSKYNTSENINDTSPNGPLRLSVGEDVDAWEQLSDGYANRYRHRMVWNPTRNIFYSFGGVVSGNNMVNDLYQYNPANGVWTQIGQSGGPSARCSALVVYDTTSNLLWVYGGRDRANPGGNQFNDLWSYNPSNNIWTKKSDGPSVRSDIAGAFNPNTSEIIAYGGYIGGAAFSSNQVFVYNTLTDEWTLKQNYTKRYYHSAVWCPKTNSMFVYGGAEKWDSGFTYVNELNEYFPNNDTWINRTPVGNRVRSLLVWDTLNNKLIIHGGGEPDRNDTWVYDIDTNIWIAKSDGPNPARDRIAGDWDPVRNQLVTFGGDINDNVPTDDVWIYSPNVTGFKPSGELTSSVFNPGHRINPRSISFSASNTQLPGIGNYPIKIKIAGSDKSPDDATKFIGPNGMTTGYFSINSGESIPEVLKGSRYLAYTVNLTTKNLVHSPEFESIRIDYYTYPSSYSYESSIIDLGDFPGLPLRSVDWNPAVPEGTDIDIYFRQSSDNVNFDSLSWENVSRGQQEFVYKSGKYFQYKAVLKTDEPSVTPILKRIIFTFNTKPTAPTLVSPGNDTWIGDPAPMLSWDFNDPDTTDYQTAFEVSLAQDDTFSMIVYNSNIVEDLFNSHTVENSLDDGIYYWKVRLRDNYGSWGPWSEFFILKIDTKKPTVPTIECMSHRLENVWYKNDRVRFDWLESSDISGIAGYSFILDSSPDTSPAENITMTTEEFERKHNAADFSGLATYDKVQDGIWYFHLKASDSLGTWSETATKILKIDTQPPTVIDLTPKFVNTGSTFDFKFTLNDTHSGISLATISWKYSSELDFRYEELALNSSGYYSLSHKLEFTDDPYIEYSIEVTDGSEPVNVMLYPPSGYKRIDIIDNEPPVITDVSYNKVQNSFKDMSITVKTADNIGVSEAEIFFNNETTGRTMKDDGGGSFSIIIDRVELTSLGDYGNEESISFKVTVWDPSGNNATSPQSGTYEITLKDVDDTEEPTKQDKEEKGMSNEFIVSLVALVIVIIIVALILFIFIRKQSEKIGEDRHKLRMAIADASEKPGAGTVEQPGVRTPAARDATSLPGTYDAAAPFGAESQSPTIDVAPTTTPKIAPSPPGQESPAGYLPEAAGVSAEPTAGEQDSQAYQQAGLMTGPSETVPDQPATETPPDSGVEVEKGVFVSLPKDSKK
jgi:N-acetylneuraminic acid mutarotase